MKLALSLTTLILAAALASSASAQTINGPQRVSGSNKGNQPVTSGTVYFPNRPKTDHGAFTLFCPNDTYDQTKNVTQTVKWNRSLKGNAGVQWGPVQAGIEASVGKTLGQQVSKTIRVKHGPDPWRSFDYCVWPAFGKFRFWGTDANGRAFEVFVFVPEGVWVQRNERKADKCPCPNLSQARNNLQNYRASLPPGQLAGELDQALAALDSGLAAGVGQTAGHLRAAANHMIVAATSLGGNEPLLDNVLLMASSSLDGIVQTTLDYVEGTDASQGGAFSEVSLLTLTEAAPFANLDLGMARAIVGDPGPGIVRYDPALQLYESAVQLSLQAEDELLVLVSGECISGPDAGPTPGTDCNPGIIAYCTAGTTSSGCRATMGAEGTPSLSNVAPFTLTCENVEANKNGIFFYSIAGANAAPWGNSNSLLCVKAPTQRMNPPASSGGTPGQCDGAFAGDWNGYVAANPGKAIHQALVPGSVVYAQAWFRDPAAGTGPVGAKGTALSDGLQFTVQP